MKQRLVILSALLFGFFLAATADDGQVTASVTRVALGEGTAVRRPV